jgi:hypothetical protein
MSFVSQYRQLIESEKRVSKATIRPRNVYRISSYEFADGEQRSLAGQDSSLIFLIGIYDKKLVSLKISEIKPDIFFKWLKTIQLKTLTEEKINESKFLDELIILDSKTGNKIFDGYVKGKPIYNKKPSPYRTYNLDGVKYIQEVNFKKDILKSFYF